MALGWPQASHVGGGRWLDAGDAKMRRRASGLVGFRLQATISRALGCVRTSGAARVELRWWPDRKRPVTATASGGGGGMHGCSTKTELRRAIEQTEKLGSIYAVWGVQRA